MKPQRSAVVVAMASAVALVAGLASAPSAEAAPGPVFTVMNTSESAPDGVYFRNSSHWSDTSRTYGLGVFMNEQVQLLCAQPNGDSVGPYNDSLWYYTRNVSRPTNFDGQPNEGMLNAHYINDGQNANVVDAGVPACVNNRPPATSTPAPTAGPSSVFFSPIPGHASPYSRDDGKTFFDGPAAADRDLAPSTWAVGTCGSAFNTSNVPPSVSTLSGWSRGRLGPIYFLSKATPAEAARINTIVLFDPGNTTNFTGSGSCDPHYDINALLAAWLKSNSSHHLIVLTGHDSEQKTLGYYGRATYAGLWRSYFAGTWHQPFATRATVCDYNNVSHYQVFNTFRNVAKYPPSGCPVSPSLPKPVTWHP